MIVAVGCCGRAGLSLREYARRFNAMEVQDTFYRIVRESTLVRWRAAVGDGFHFTVKAFQGVSHPRSSPTWRRAGSAPGGRPENYGLLKDTEEVDASWRSTEEMAETLGAEYVVVQMPASFTPTDDNLRRIADFFSRRRGERRVGLEVRGDEWAARSGDLGDALRAAGVTHVVDPLIWPPAHVEGPAYFRLHGRLPHYDYQYRTEELIKLAELVENFHKAYVFFNNMAMAEDAARFSDAVGGGAAGLPGPEERAGLILRSMRVPTDSASISRRFGYLRVGVEGEPTIGELIGGVGKISTGEELIRVLSRRSGGTCSDTS